MASVHSGSINDEDQAVKARRLFTRGISFKKSHLTKLSPAHKAVTFNPYTFEMSPNTSDDLYFVDEYNFIMFPSVDRKTVGKTFHQLLIELFKLDVFKRAESSGHFSQPTRIYSVSLGPDDSIFWHSRLGSTNYTFQLWNVELPKRVLTGLQAFSLLYSGKFTEDDAQIYKYIAKYVLTDDEQFRKYNTKVDVSEEPVEPHEPTVISKQQELQLAFQLIDRLTRRVEELEKALLQVGKVITSETEDVKEKPQKLPAYQRRRKINPNPDPPWYVTNNPSYPYFVPGTDCGPYPVDNFDKMNWLAMNKTPNWGKGGRQPPPAPFHVKFNPNQKFTKPTPEKCLNPKFAAEDKKDNVKFYKMKVQKLSKALADTRALPSDSEEARKKKSKDRGNIRRGRIRAYQALECLGVNQYSAKSRYQQRINNQYQQVQRLPMAPCYYPVRCN